MQSERVVKGAVYLTLQSIAIYLFSFLFYILIARALGAAEVGKLSILLMISAVFSLTNLSINYALQKFIPAYIEEGKADEIGSIIRTGLTALIGTSVTILIVLIAFNAELSTIIFGSASERWPIVMILLASFTLNLTAFFGGEMLGLGMFKETAIQNILNSGISRTLAIILAMIGLGLMGVTISWLIAATTALAFSIYVLRRNLRLENGFPVKRILGFALPAHTFVAITFVREWADIAILYALASNLSQIGTYYLVVSGAMILALFYTPIGTVILPALSSRYSQNGDEGITPMADTYIRISCKILLPIGFAFAALASTAIEVAYGQQYVSGAIPFAMLAATSIIPALTLLMVTIIQSTGNTRPLILIGITAAIMDITVVAALAPSFGGTAGAAGRIAFSTVVVILGYYFIRNKIKLHIARELRHPLIAAIIIAVPLYLTDQYLSHTLNLALRLRAPIDILEFMILATAFTYFTRYLTKEDFGTIRQAMPKQLEKVIDKVEIIFTRR